MLDPTVMEICSISHWVWYHLKMWWVGLSFFQWTILNILESYTWTQTRNWSFINLFKYLDVFISLLSKLCPKNEKDPHVLMLALTVPCTANDLVQFSNTLCIQTRAMEGSRIGISSILIFLIHHRTSSSTWWIRACGGEWNDHHLSSDKWQFQ